MCLKSMEAIAFEFSLRLKKVLGILLRGEGGSICLNLSLKMSRILSQILL